MVGVYARRLDLVVVVLLWLALMTGCGRPSARALTSFMVPAGDSLQVGVTPSLALSPTGNLLVYVGRHGSVTRLYLKADSGGEPRALDGTEGAANPFFSPDGRWVGFFAGGKLKKLLLEEANSATPTAICDASGPRGASWGDDGTIVFAIADRTELLGVSADGGESRPLTQPTGPEDFGHRWPHVLSGGKGVLFAIDTGAGFDHARIASLSQETGEIRPLIDNGSSPAYVGGHLLYAHDNTLFAAPIDEAGLKITGPAVPAVRDVAFSQFYGGAHFSVANNGRLAYISRDVAEAQRALVWVDRKGTATPLTNIKRAYWEPRLSPDGTRLAFVLQKPTYEVWTYDLSAERFTRLSMPGVDSGSPTWSRDSRQLTFYANTTGGSTLFRATADGSGPREQLLTNRSMDFPFGWSSDGRTLVFGRYYPPSGWDIWVFGPKSGARPWLRGPAHQGGAKLSPDARWMAYISTESGRSEVYVQPYPGPGDRRRVSPSGGREPVWSPDGRELFYYEGEKLMSAHLAGNSKSTDGPPLALFEGPYVRGDAGDPNFDVAPDGSKFIMVRSEIEPEQLEIRVVPDWVQDPPK